MICAACGEPTAGAPCEECGASPLLDGRYRLEAALGTGSSGTTWRGSSLVDGKPLATVAIKELRVAILDSTKARELVEREIRVLREVEHSAIPRYWEDLFVGKGRSKAIYIVQDFVDGQTLAEESRHKRYSEDEVLDIVAEMLRILTYLHALRPPIVHRDIKPANVIRRIDGRLALIDFGSVRDCVKGDLGGSTVAGTFGYMAPEQFRGDAWPVTDLYGVGALAAALLARKEPQTMLDWSGRLKWEDATAASPSLTAFLRRMLAPDPMERFPSASDALRELDRQRRPASPSGTILPKFQPIAAPRELRSTLERIADVQPGTARTLADASFVLMPTGEWGRDNLPAPLIRWTSALPRRPDPPAIVPIYVSDTEATSPQPPERPGVLVGAMVGAIGATILALVLTLGVFAAAVAWAVVPALGYGAEASPTTTGPAAIAPGPVPPDDLRAALLSDPAIDSCLRGWRARNPTSDAVDIAQLEISRMASTPRIDSYVFDNLPEAQELDQCLADGVRAAEVRIPIDAVGTGTVRITALDLDAIDLDRNEVSALDRALPGHP